MEKEAGLIVICNKICIRVLYRYTYIIDMFKPLTQKTNNTNRLIHYSSKFVVGRIFQFFENLMLTKHQLT